MRDGARNISVPIARAVLRSLAVNAAKGQHRSQRLFAELLSAVETSNKLLYDERIETTITYKNDWDRELERRRVLGIIHLADPLPHPDHVRIDMQRGTARIVGPATKEEKAKRDAWMARKADFEAEVEELQQLILTKEDPGMRKFREEDQARSRKIVAFLNKAQRGEG